MFKYVLNKDISQTNFLLINQEIEKYLKKKNIQQQNDSQVLEYQYHYLKLIYRYFSTSKLNIYDPEVSHHEFLETYKVI